MDDKIVAAIAKIQRISPFFSYLVSNLNFRVTDSLQEMMFSKTAIVDGDGNVTFYKKRLDELSTSELAFVILHEVLHCALDHLNPIDDEGKNIALVGIAQDIYVNEYLIANVDTDEITPPRNRVRAKDFGIENPLDKSWEQIYYELLKKTIIIPITFDVHEYKGSEEKDWKQVLANAYVYSKGVGKEKGDIESLVEIALHKPKVNWKRLLRDFVSKSIPFDYRFFPPNKKSFVLGQYLSRMEKKSLNIAVVIDTSGSIEDKEYSEFVNEVIHISKMESVDVTVIQCDAEVQKVYKKKELDKLKYRKGYGGTDYSVPFKWINKNLRNVDMVIYFGDGYAYEFPDSKDIGNRRVLWVINKNGVSENSREWKVMKSLGTVVKM